MIGGEPDIFGTLAPGAGSSAKTPSREGRTPTAEQGYLHCGPNGAGHFVKMVHNGIEYGMMGAYAEGLNILNHANIGKAAAAAADAETTPLRDPAAYQYDFDLADVAEVWRRGSVIASWLLDLTAAALAASPGLDDFQGLVSDSGEGRWTLDAAIDEAVPANVLAAALFARFTSRGQADFQNRVLSGPDRGGRAVSGVRMAPESGHRCGRNELQFGVGDRQRASAPLPGHLTRRSDNRVFMASASPSSGRAWPSTSSCAHDTLASRRSSVHQSAPPCD
ncbi:hypothetical protein BH11GEM1_BH11GEM1_33700 [soil metagenome]